MLRRQRTKPRRVSRSVISTSESLRLRLRVPSPPRPRPGREPLTVLADLESDRVNSLIVIFRISSIIQQTPHCCVAHTHIHTGTGRYRSAVPAHYGARVSVSCGLLWRRKGKWNPDTQRRTWQLSPACARRPRRLLIARVAHATSSEMTFSTSFWRSASLPSVQPSLMSAA